VGTNALEPFNSDIAIPVLMANDEHWDLFQCFYYGQDRFGAWPFLLVRIAGLGLQAVIRWEHLEAVMIIWVLAGSLAFAALCRPAAAPAMLVFLFALLANPDLRILFNMSQPYGWQATALLLAWWSMRAVLQASATGSAGGAWSYRVLSLVSAILATWMSPVSGPILLLLAGLELARVRVLDRSDRRWGLAILNVGLPVFAAIAFEAVLRTAYHQFASSRFGWDFHTSLRVDWGRLAENAKIVAHAVVGFRWLSLYLAGALAICGAALLIVKRSLKSNADRLMLEYPFVVLGLAGSALVQLPILIAVDHVRFGGFDVRYFALVQLFGTLAGLLGLAGALVLALARLKAWVTVLRVASAGGILALAFFLPRPVDDPAYKHLEHTADELARRAPGAVLLGDYWDTYQIAALQPHSLTPLPFEGQYLRIPWNVAALSESREIIVAHRGADEDPATRIGPELNQYGTKLRLVVSDWYQDGDRRYSLYRRKVANPTDAPLQ
jgi:hypothetical protein